VVDADHTANAEKRAFEHGLCGHPLHTALTRPVSRFRQSGNKCRPDDKPALQVFHPRRRRTRRGRLLSAPGDLKEAARDVIELLSRADRAREMGKTARINAKKKFCANDVIPAYENYYKRILAERK
jgi:hypothetical protein